MLLITHTHHKTTSTLYLTVQSGLLTALWPVLGQRTLLCVGLDCCRGHPVTNVCDRHKWRRYLKVVNSLSLILGHTNTYIHTAHTHIHTKIHSSLTSSWLVSTLFSSTIGTAQHSTAHHRSGELYALSSSKPSAILIITPFAGSFHCKNAITD